MTERLSPAAAASIRARRQALGIIQEQFALIAAVQSASVSYIETCSRVRSSAVVRVMAALDALEAGASRHEAREIALTAAPIVRLGTSGNHSRKSAVQRRVRTPDVELLPAGCFVGRNVRTRMTGRIGRPEPRLVAEAMS